MPVASLGSTPSFGIASFDAFGRLRVSDLQTVFDAKTIYDDAPLYFVNNVTAGASVVFTLATASNRLTVDGTAGARATRQSRRYLDYQPGKSQKIELTFDMVNGGQANIAKRAGYFDNGNGTFFQLNGLTNQFVRRSNASGVTVDTAVSQDSWNLDRLNGFGKSGINLDNVKVQIGTMDLEWLGSGSVRQGFVIDGRNVYAHVFQQANVGTQVWAQTPNLPVRWEIENLAASAGGSMDAICCTVGTESGAQLVGISRPADRGITGIATDQTFRPLIAIRLKAAYNRATVIPRIVNILASTASNCRWSAQVNPTVTGGAAAVWVPKASSAVEYDVSRNGVLNQDGIEVASGYFASSVSSAAIELAGTYALASDYAGVPDQLVIGVQNTAPVPETFFGSIIWNEET